jgi:hypothetical protein
MKANGGARARFKTAWGGGGAVGSVFRQLFIFLFSLLFTIFGKVRFMDFYMKLFV